MTNKHEIYLLENIIPLYSENLLVETNKYSLVLLKASEKSNLLSEEDNYNYRVVESTKNQIEKLHEGQYVFFDEKENKFENANRTSIAKRNFYYNNFYRGKLLKKQTQQTESYEINPNVNVFSYHINVGHGNCSIIVIKDLEQIKLWMVDCSDYDFFNHQSYRKNIDACFKHIKTKFSLHKIIIDKFFLTHTHYDHYSGVSRLIDLRKITPDTVFYWNLHYSMPSENYNRLLRKINQLNPQVIEPLSTIQSNGIEIWHPHNRTIRSNSAKYLGQTVEIEPKPNNSSVVYYFKFGEKKILFPGDLETEKWNIINCCPQYLKDSNYFVISHHGSINGHLRNSCPVNRNIQNLSNCVMPRSTQILMGRDGAYSGIYSNQVIKDFKNLIYSEKDSNNLSCKFLEIDWNSNNKIWI